MVNKYLMVIIAGCKDGKVLITMNHIENTEMLLENTLKLISCLLFMNGMKTIKYQKKFISQQVNCHTKSFINQQIYR